MISIKKGFMALCFGTTAVLSGMLLALAFAPYNIFPFAIIAPAILLFLWLRSSRFGAFIFGFLFGCGLFGAGVYWVYHSIHVFGGVPALPAFGITALFIAILSLFPAATGYFLNRFFPYQTPSKLLCAFPALWVFSEWLRSLLCTGFPLLFIGYSQINSPLKGLAPILSVYGVSFAALLSSALIVNAIIELRQKNYKTAYLQLFIFASVWIGSSALMLVPWTQPSGKPLSISLVQGDIPQDLKWSPEHLQLSFDRYQKLTEPLWGKHQLIIWPEAAIPVPLQNIEGFIEMLDQKAKQNHTHLMLGIPIQADSGGYYNALITLGNEKSMYLKQHLVPFGEYTPSIRYLDFIIKKMNIPMAMMTPGGYHQKLMRMNSLNILPSVCYEIAFPELMRVKDDKINFLLTVTNDAWFGDTSAKAQHLQMAMMRAMEQKRPVVFVSNDGITAVISPNGQIAASAPPSQPYVLNTTVQGMSGLTPWMRYGTNPIFTILILLCIISLKDQAEYKKNTLLPAPAASCGKEQLKISD